MPASPTLRSLLSGLAMAASLAALVSPAAATDPAAVERQVRSVIEPVMREASIPGMAVVVIENGRRHQFNFGVDAPSGGKPVTADTLFELGSLSKTFTATLGATAEAEGHLSLSDPAERYEPALAGHPIGRATLLDLATYTAAGLPLQFPDDVSGNEAILRYFQNFRPEVEPGTVRRYSNPSIGLFGDLAGRATGEGFEATMTRDILPALGLRSTFLTVPEREMPRYAFGTAPTGEAIRVSPGPLDGSAYGLKSTATDMARFVEVQIDPSSLPAPLRAGVEATHLGHARVGPMVQGLGWEQYPYPVDVEMLLTGNSADMALKPQTATRLDPPQAPQGAVLFNKTGSTRGFGAYAAFVPERRIGVVFLANRNWPNATRVRAGHAILSALD
ncbi:beta-lactamase class C [Aureimonas phyllosphaerae]|uniref:Beta-lactamase n=2 Tax=Aureimonas phyllosphaerae TaxID=1166078 RepID=A0A7W6FV41_9HYPH|nr:class C beta-lactamase [Aureimonas phyllosphaerae]MBB3936751.1 beta-lactamase class C [Aureimonas phyllosphaerae]MBB3960386.1 beta-lactamase class C [Aureimonas phyllosphaerae]SFF22327.1 beta-lactamase class C [Aureimonas phyllosphaerae]